MIPCLNVQERKVGDTIFACEVSSFSVLDIDTLVSLPVACRILACYIY